MSAQEQLFSVFIFLIATGAFGPLLESIGTGAEIRTNLRLTGGGGGWAVLALWAVFYAFAALRLVPHGAFVKEAVRTDLSLVLFVVFAWASTAWSVEPVVSFRAGLSLAGTTIIGLFFGLRYTTRQFLQLIFAATLVAAAVSLLSGVFGVAVGVDPIQPKSGGVRGVFVSKNLTGQVMVLALATSLFLATGEKTWTRVTRVGALVTGLLVLLSRSVTSWVVALLLVLEVALILRLRLTPRRHFGLLIGSAVALVLMGFLTAYDFWGIDPEPLFGIVDRDATLTGRTHIWLAVMTQIGQRPLLGWGLDAFWMWDGPAVEVVVRSLGFHPDYAHNGFIDVLLGLGLIGAGLLLVDMVRSLGRALLWADRRSGPVRLWPAIALSFLFLANLTESGLIDGGFYMWILYVALATRLRVNLAMRPPSGA